MSTVAETCRCAACVDRCSWISDASRRGPTPPSSGTAFRSLSISSETWPSMTSSHGASSRCTSSLVRNTRRRKELRRSLVWSRRATKSSSVARLTVSDDTMGSIFSSGRIPEVSFFSSRSLPFRRATSASSSALMSSLRCRSVAVSSAGAAAMMRSADRESSSDVRVGETRLSTLSSRVPTC